MTANMCSRFLRELVEQGVSLHALGNFIKVLEQLLPLFGDIDRLLVTLGRFLQAVPSSPAAVASFEKDPESLGAASWRFLRRAHFSARLSLPSPMFGKLFEEVVVGQKSGSPCAML